MIDLFRKLESLGCTMVVWSGGGIDYARHWTRRLGLKAQVHPKGAFIADIAVDDLPDGDGSKLGKVIIKV